MWENNSESIATRIRQQLLELLASTDRCPIRRKPRNFPNTKATYNPLQSPISSHFQQLLLLLLKIHNDNGRSLKSTVSFEPTECDEIAQLSSPTTWQCFALFTPSNDINRLDSTTDLNPISQKPGMIVSLYPRNGNSKLSSDPPRKELGKEKAQD